MAEFTQDNRPFRLQTPLGTDVLLFRRMFGGGGINRLFTYEVEALNESGVEFDINNLIGQSATVFIDAEPAPRYINGIVTKCAYIGEDKDFRHYHLTLQPALWLLTLNASSRIFQQKPITDILKAVLGKIDVNYNLQRSYEPVNYCVQYRETDFNFVSRLMEQEGISYSFLHSEGKHTLVLSDSSGQVSTGDYSIPYVSGAVLSDQNIVMSEWRAAREIPLKTVTLWDAHFGLPQKHLEATKNASGDAAKLAAGEFYDFPGGQAVPFDPTSPGGGDTQSELNKIFTLNGLYAGIRLQEANARFNEMTGVTNVRLLFAGETFTLTDHPVAAQNQAYLVLSSECTIVGDNYLSGSETSETVILQITAIPITTQYRPPRVTRKPIIPGAQTAFVVGPSNDEIFVDKYGRVKVQFNWDRTGKEDENSSCWLRVAQIWAGQGWGAMAIPRIGHEVIVDFLEGDPDQPIITGRVYNANNMPPYSLPANMTVTTIKSRSSKNSTGFNEIKFEDKAGSEEIYVHAEKDFNRVVMNDESIDIKQNRTKHIREGNETINIDKGNRATTIAQGNETLSINTGNRTTTIDKGNETIAINTGNRTTTIDKGNETIAINTGGRGTTIKGDDTLDVKEGNVSTTIDTGNDTLTIKTGNMTIKLDQGAYSLEAMQSITLKVGANSIKIDQQGITLDGAMITVNGSAEVKVKGGATLNMSAPATSVGGTATLTLKGGMVQIN
jgi:type VI secretion system secreted protein VgrG